MSTCALEQLPPLPFREVIHGRYHAEIFIESRMVPFLERSGYPVNCQNSLIVDKECGHAVSLCKLFGVGLCSYLA